MTTVAFVGLGLMGGPMSANLAKAGIALRSYDLKVKGTCASVREAAQGADVLITMLPDGSVVRDVVLEALPVLAPHAVVVDMSSSDPSGTRALGKALAARGIALVDAPVSGAVIKAKDGTLAIMAGGEDGVVEKVRPVLEKMGERIFHVGPLGAGHAVKALNNYLGAAGTLAAFEALLVARSFGLEAQPMLEAINASTGRNSATDRKIPQQVLTGAFASGFKLALMAKDVGIAAGLARDQRVSAPYLKATLKLWQEAQRSLPRNADHTEIFKYLGSLSKKRLRKAASARPRRAVKKRARRSRG